MAAKEQVKRGFGEALQAGLRELWLKCIAALAISACVLGCGGAAGNLAIGTAAWTVVGCTAQGCPPPDVCNKKTKWCEPPPCAEDLSCPAGYDCDAKDMVCR